MSYPFIQHKEKKCSIQSRMQNAVFFIDVSSGNCNICDQCSSINTDDGTVPMHKAGFLRDSTRESKSCR